MTRSVRVHGARYRTDAEARAQRDQTIAHHRAHAGGDSPQNPRSIARWMHRTLTGPTGAAIENPYDQADGDDERVRDIIHQSGRAQGQRRHLRGQQTRPQDFVASA